MGRQSFTLKWTAIGGYVLLEIPRNHLDLVLSINIVPESNIFFEDLMHLFVRKLFFGFETRTISYLQSENQCWTLLVPGSFQNICHQSVGQESSDHAELCGSNKGKLKELN